MTSKPLLVAALCALALCFCGKADLGKTARVEVPPLPEGEVEEYSVLVGDEEIGTYAMTTRRGGFRETSAWRFDLVSRTRQGAIETVDSSAVFVTRDSMKPISSFRFIRTGNALVTTAANYSPGSVAIATYSEQEQKERMLPTNAVTYDEDELTSLGRAIQIPTTGRPADIQVVSPMGPPFGGAVTDGKIGAGSDERVTVPAGTFDCYKLILNVGPNVIVLWYEKAGSHRMVRYATSGGSMTMELLPRNEKTPPGTGAH
jgi:hypothetical protein